MNAEAPSMPRTCLPPWGTAELPEPRPIRWGDWRAFIGPGIVMMGIQIGAGEWLLGPEITARYGGGLMWIATVAILVQVFYNLECGRYALYCGEPIFTGFLRSRPGPLFWTSFFLLLNLGAAIPGIATHVAAVAAAGILDRPPGEGDRGLVAGISYVSFVLMVVPILFGGKIYNTLQWVMTAKVLVVLLFTLGIGVLFVKAGSWLDIFGGFVKFGTVPAVDPAGGGLTVNAAAQLLSGGGWPSITLSDIAVLGAFAGYAGGGGLGNSLYSNFVRDKGWGMGSRVGAIASAIGGKMITLSHLGKVFPPSDENRRRWKGWWKHVLADQLVIWAPGCFVGMALPGLLSLEFAPHSPLYGQKQSFDWAQAVLTADGMRHAPGLPPWLATFLWTAMLIAGILVLAPSQMSVIDEVSRRWTDVIWSASARVRQGMGGSQSRRIYYGILIGYLSWCLFSLYLFSRYGTPKLMTLIIPNLGNFALGFTAFFLLRVNSRLIPKEFGPRWHHKLGLIACGAFYLGLAILVFITKQIPMLRELLGV
jgi:hypothetical protein